MRPAVYTRAQLQAWEQRWFAAGNNSYGLMQQAAWQMTQRIVHQLQQLTQAKPVVGVWCGTGNNAGDGYLIAAYLQQAGYPVWIWQRGEPTSGDVVQAYHQAQAQQIPMYKDVLALPYSHLDVDAIYGIGLNRPLSEADQHVVTRFNQRDSYKVAVDMPTGLHADTGVVLGVACQVDLTLTVLGLKAGLLTGQGKAYAGQVVVMSLIPTDGALAACAYLDMTMPILPKRLATSHKGTHGHVLVVGGDANMGGAAILAAEAALAVGAGKVTLLTDEKHHTAALTRAPNMMTLALPVSIDALTPDYLKQRLTGFDVVVIGMGLGRHAWGEAVWQAFKPLLEDPHIVPRVVVDADALYHLAGDAPENAQHHAHWYLTPHSGEAARLLGLSADAVEHDRLMAVHGLKQRYGGHCLLKGAGSLSLDDLGLSICGLGNAGMATAGMGDTLAGMAGGLLAQFPDLPLHDIVALHAAAGDLLAQSGERGLQATELLTVIKQVVN